MSPRIKQEKLERIDAERIREIIKSQKMKVSHFCEEQLNISYRNFCKILSKGEMDRRDLERMCDALNVSKEYLTGNSPVKMPRMMDFSVPEKKREALKELLKYSNRTQDIIDKVDELDMFAITHLTFLVELAITNPQEFYKIVFGGNNPNEFEERKDD